MTIVQLCEQLGAALMMRIQYPRNEFETCAGTHTCYLDPERCAVFIDGKRSLPGFPFGIGWNEREAMTDLVAGLLELRKPHGKAPVHSIVIRCRSLYDNQIREIPIPADLTA
ncbi:MAG: hypothetical protein AAB375_01290 [Patescibacteria group bacterium]